MRSSNICYLIIRSGAAVFGVHLASRDEGTRATQNSLLPRPGQPCLSANHNGLVNTRPGKLITWEEQESMSWGEQGSGPDQIADPSPEPPVFAERCPCKPHLEAAPPQPPCWLPAHCEIHLHSAPMQAAKHLYSEPRACLLS